jgi:flavin-dependent dehydrogenase
MIFDFLIIGAGPAGSTIALLLAEAGFSVAIIEKKIFPRRKVCGEFISATSFSLLQKLGIADFYSQESGPEVHRIGIFAGNTVLTSQMPALKIETAKWGRAYGREHLDTKLLNKALAAGARCWQPAIIQNMQHHATFSSCEILSEHNLEKISARYLIDAAGSWERAIDRKQSIKHNLHDLLAFKAHFSHSNLPTDLMPLIAFPGGYGGLVNTDNGRVTLSCCIHRDTLKQVRKRYPLLSAGEAVMQHITHFCRGVREVFAEATLEGKWLAAGPIRPGIRKCYDRKFLYIGNIAGEAHPVVAEGISMAMQSAWLLAELLIEHRDSMLSGDKIHLVGKEYSKRWRAHFAARIRFASLFAHVTMRPRVMAVILPLFYLFPRLISFAGKLSGKITQVVPATNKL